VRRAACYLVSVALLIAAPLSAQAPQATPTQTDQPIFRAGVDVVRLDLRATDASGKPIPDLRPDEVEVIDDGGRQPIVLFQHIVASGRNYSEAAQRTIASEVSTNQGAPRGQLYVLVFDQLHITTGTETKVRESAEAFLRKRFRPEDRVAVFGLPGPGPNQPFTSSLSSAIAQLQSVKGDLQRVPTPGDRDMTVNEAYEILRGNDAVLTRFMTATNGVPDRTGILPDVSGKFGGGDPATTRQLVKDHANQVVADADADSRRFLDMMSQLLRGFRGIDGRKTVILFSEGFHSDNVSRVIDDVAAASAECYAVVYSFDLNRRTENLGTMPVGSDTGAEISSRLEPMGTLSTETNGRLVIDALSHLDEALDSLGEAEPDYYVIGFPASSAALASREEYRRVTVRVKRPGVHVSTRTGYVAGPPQTPADRRKTIDTALAAPFGQQGLKVEYTTYIGQSDRPGLQGVAVSLESELPIAPASANLAADVVFVVHDLRTGQTVASGTDQVALPHAPAPGSTTGRGTWRTRFDLNAGEYIMRCIVREPGGLVGSADRQFTVRALSGPDPATSDLVLGTPGDRLPVRTVAYTDDLLSGAVRVYGRSEAQLAGLSAALDLVSLTTTPADNPDHPVQSIGGVVGTSHASDAGVLRDVTFTLPLSDVPPGSYIAHVVVRAGGEVVSDLRRQVEVVSGTRPASVEAPAGAAPPPNSTSTPASPNAKDILHGGIVKQIVEQANRSDVAAVRQAASQAATGRWSQVATALAATPAADPDAGRLRALARFDSGDYASAVSDLERLFDASPNDANLAFVLGWARIGAGQQVAAASAFRSAAYLDPTLVPAHLALAETYLRLNQPALAVQVLEAGLAKLPQSVELKQMLAGLKK
jgi:VWFA-related protein